MLMNQSVGAPERDLFERILASAPFHKSPRSSELLRYLGQRYFSGSGEPIHEAQIGDELFGRGADFDPSTDSIVRASIRQLRARLAEFYSSEGAGEALELHIPKGEYRLRFEPRSLDTPASRPDPSPPRRPWMPFHRSSLALPAFAAVALAAFLLGAWLRPLDSRIAARNTPAAPHPPNSIIEHFLDQTSGPVHFVPSDSIFGLIKSFANEEFTFADYQSRRPFDPAHPASLLNPQHWAGLVSRELLNIGDASIALRAVRDHPAHAKRMFFLQSRDLKTRDLRSGNYIFLGSAVSNPWVEVFQPNLNFVFRHRNHGEPRRWRNLAPQEGEEPWYPPAAQAPGSGGRSHAQVACLPNLSRSGLVLLIAGNSQPDTEAAGEFVLSPHSALTLGSAIGVSKLSEALGFDVLLGTERTGNALRVTEVMAHRILRQQVLHAGSTPASPAR